MPAAAVLPIILAATAATSAGIGIYDVTHQGGQTPQQQLQAETPAAVSQLQQQRAYEASQAGQLLPGIEENTSGGVSPQYLSQFGAAGSGYGDLLGTSQLSQLVNNFLGQGGTAATSGGTNNGINPALASLAPGLSSSGIGSNSAIAGLVPQLLSGGQGGQQQNNPFAYSSFS